MKNSIKEYIKTCSICQQAKPEHVKYLGLLAPLPVPTAPWSVVSMDFIEGLPSSNKQDVILVVIGKFSKYAHFMALSHPFTALQVAQSYMNNVYKLHGLPAAIISDRDRIFTSSVWQELFKLTDTQLLMSSSYHPQTDGQTERLNQCIEAFLRCTVHACPKQWSKWLPLAEFWYNSNYHSALGHTPLEVLYGHQPLHFGIGTPSACSVPELDQWLKDRELLTRLIHQQLTRAQQRMKSQADKNRTDRVFQEGDMVYLKLQPYIQTSVASRSNQKLSFRFYAPFRILKRIGQVAYKLDLPSHCKIHPVIHVSQLKAHVAAHVEVSPDIDIPSEPVEDTSPVVVLDHRLIQVGSSYRSQVKLRWSGLPSSLTTWEEVHDIRRRFPMAPAWGQAGIQGGGSVTALKPPVPSIVCG